MASIIRFDSHVTEAKALVAKPGESFSQPVTWITPLVSAFGSHDDLENAPPSEGFTVPDESNALLVDYLHDDDGDNDEETELPKQAPILTWALPSPV